MIFCVLSFCIVQSDIRCVHAFLHICLMVVSPLLSGGECRANFIFPKGLHAPLSVIFFSFLCDLAHSGNDVVMG